MQPVPGSRLTGLPQTSLRLLCSAWGAYSPLAICMTGGGGCGCVRQHGVSCIMLVYQQTGECFDRRLSHSQSQAGLVGSIVRRLLHMSSWDPRLASTSAPDTTHPGVDPPMWCFELTSASGFPQHAARSIHDPLKLKHNAESALVSGTALCKLCSENSV